MGEMKKKVKKPHISNFCSSLSVIFLMQLILWTFFLTFAELVSCLSTSLLMHSCSREPMILTFGLKNIKSSGDNQSQIHSTCVR